MHKAEPPPPLPPLCALLCSSHSTGRQGSLLSPAQPYCSSHPQVQDGQITHIQYEQGSQFLQEPQVRQVVGADGVQ